MSDFAKRGSQRWLQVAVNKNPKIINGKFREVLGLPSNENITWVSPLSADNFKEYRDMEALRQLGIESLDEYKLSNFWPARGPVWDADSVNNFV